MGAGAQRKYAEKSPEAAMGHASSEPTMNKAQSTASESSGSSKPRTHFRGHKLRKTLPVPQLTVEVSKEALAPKPAGYRTIRLTTSFSSEYTLGDEVMPSTNYGTRVHYATRLSDGAAVVVKHRLKDKSFRTLDSEHQAWRTSTEYLLNLPHNDHITELYEVLEDSEAYYVIMEKVEGLDLFESLSSPDRPDKAGTQQILLQLLEAVAALHEKGYIHRDIKLENVMVDHSPKYISSPKSAKSASKGVKALSAFEFVESQRPTTVPGGCSDSPEEAPGDCRDNPEDPFSEEQQEGSTSLNSSGPVVKLIDFDTVEDYSPKKTAKVVMGTDMYIAQEAYSGHYSPASDIFAIGVIGYKLLTGKFPFPDSVFAQGDNTVGSPTMQHTQQNLKNFTIDWTRPPFDMDAEAADLFRSMMAHNDVDRPTAMQAQQHPWFSKTFEEAVSDDFDKQVSDTLFQDLDEQ